MTHAEFKIILAKLLPQVESESKWLTPFPAKTINAFSVFDALRESTEPPITEEEFNIIADELQP